jgi:hypothetical protein
MLIIIAATGELVCCDGQPGNIWGTPGGDTWAAGGHGVMQLRRR